MRKIIVLWLALLSPRMCSSLAAQTLTDTLWSVSSLDGTISYRPSINLFHLTTSALEMSIGDGYDVFNEAEVFARGYLSFRLTDLTHLDSLPIAQAVIGIYQFDTTGNDTGGIYPIWDVAGGDTHFCVLDHIDYGSSLDLGDWTAGDPGDPQTLQTKIGIISDNAVVEYKTLDVTQQVSHDIANERAYSQYRMRFTIDRDFDLLGDNLLMRSGNSIVTKPFLAVQYDTTSMVIENLTSGITDFLLNQNYPNPFNPATTIAYSITKTGHVELTIFNILGHRIQTLINTTQTQGNYTISFDASRLSSGIYYYRLQFEKQSVTRKMLLIQ